VDLTSGTELAEPRFDVDHRGAVDGVEVFDLRQIPAPGSVNRAWPLELLVRAELALGGHESAATHLTESA
jgi:hypothetical protein